MATSPIDSTDAASSVRAASTIEEPASRRRLFVAANLSMFMIGLGFAVRATIAPALQRDLFDPIDIATSGYRVGQSLGITFTGFALTLLFGSALVDLVGMRRMMVFAAFGFVAGSALVLMASLLPLGPTTYPLVLAGLLLTGLGWGAVEAASNPMVAALYPQEKTRHLNILHAWWPAGIVVGGLAGVGLANLGLPWQSNLLVLIVPSLLLAFLAATTSFPVSERVKLGVSYADMFRELRAQPMFLVWFFAMMLTTASELAPGQMVEIVLSRIVGMHGIYLLVYVSGLMFVFRHFAGPLARKVSSIGVLWLGSALTALGLYGLSLANAPAPAFAAATVWGIGVCFLYPTMVASVAERFPRGGALFMGLIGFAGGISIQFILPRLGSIFDAAKLRAAGGAEKFSALEAAQLESILREASVQTFHALVWIPLLLLPIFGVLWWRDRSASRCAGQALVPESARIDR
jgi:fucose permease